MHVMLGINAQLGQLAAAQGLVTTAINTINTTLGEVQAEVGLLKRGRDGTTKNLRAAHQDAHEEHTHALWRRPPASPPSSPPRLPPAWPTPP